MYSCLELRWLCLHILAFVDYLLGAVTKIYEVKCQLSHSNFLKAATWDGSNRNQLSSIGSGLGKFCDLFKRPWPWKPLAEQKGVCNMICRRVPLFLRHPTVRLWSMWSRQLHGMNHEVYYCRLLQTMNNDWKGCKKNFSAKMVVDLLTEVCVMSWLWEVAWWKCMILCWWLVLFML